MFPYMNSDLLQWGNIICDDGHCFYFRVGHKIQVEHMSFQN